MYYFIERFDYVLVSSVIINAEMSVISSVVAFRPSVTQNIFYHKINWKTFFTMKTIKSN